jgi:hypothetical protein
MVGLSKLTAAIFACNEGGIGVAPCELREAIKLVREFEGGGGGGRV